MKPILAPKRNLPFQVITASDIPEDKLRAFLDAFSGRKERILMKWEADDMKGKPDNLMLKKWLPQQECVILAFWSW